MKTKIFIFIFVLAILFCCKKESKKCPSCSDQVSWNTYGKWNIGTEGYDGHSYDRNTSLESDCGWTIYKDFTGGTGKIYVVQNYNGGVKFVWEFTQFSSIELSEGWCGSTQDGIKINDTISKFLKVYPYFKCNNDSSVLSYVINELKQGQRYIDAYFSKDKKLTKLRIRI